jgi:hypothetical protein
MCAEINFAHIVVGYHSIISRVRGVVCSNVV